MQQVLSGLQLESGIGCVSLYLDDMIVFSESLIDYIDYLKAAFNRLRKAGHGLMLNPKKCKVVCDEIEYLGHVVTLQGLKPNNRILDAFRCFSNNNFWDLHHIIVILYQITLELHIFYTVLPGKGHHLNDQQIVKLLLTP